MTGWPQAITVLITVYCISQYSAYTFRIAIILRVIYTMVCMHSRDNHVDAER
jgi:hypothetical protein